MSLTPCLVEQGRHLLGVNRDKSQSSLISLVLGAVCSGAHSRTKWDLLRCRMCGCVVWTWVMYTYIYMEYITGRY